MANDAGWQGVVTTLVSDRGDALQRYAVLLCGDQDDAADLVQDALVATFGRLRNGFGVSSAEAYVRRAILNTYLDGGRRRSRWRRIRHLAVSPETIDPPDAGIESRIDVQGELARLSPRERACVVLRYYDDLTVPETAERLGLAPGTVKRYLSDGLAKMAISLADDGTVEDRLTPRPHTSQKGASRGHRI